MGASDQAELLGRLDLAERDEGLDVGLVGAAGAGVVDVGELDHGRAEVGERLELLGRKMTSGPGRNAHRGDPRVFVGPRRRI